MTSRVRITVLLALLAAAPGCRVKQPTVAEQRELMARGSFAGEVPAWVSRSAMSGLGAQVQQSSGYIPERFGPPSQLRSDPSDSPLVAVEGEEARRLNEREVKAAITKSSGQTPEAIEQATSPLAKIAERCPTVEEDVRKALVTTEVAQRIEVYQILVQRCAESADLWIWLGKDYLTVGKPVAARRAFERATVLEPTNADANRLLQDAQTQMEAQPPAQ